MSDYFVSASRGSDSTGDGSAANPWRTIGKAIGSSPAISLPASGGATLWIEPGVYREAVTLGLSPTASAPLVIRGDFDGAGFAAAGQTNLKKGALSWRAWSDVTTPLALPCLNVAGLSNITIKRVKFLGGQVGNGVGSCVHASGATNLTIQDCVLAAYPSTNRYALELQSTAGAAINATVERCVFKPTVNTNPALRIRGEKQATGYGLNVAIKACVFQGGYSQVVLESTGSGAGLAGGIAIQNCTFIDPNQYSCLAYNGDATVASSPRVMIYDSILIGGGIRAGHVSQAVEDGNSFTNALRTNVEIGGNSDPGPVEPSLNFLDEVAGGLALRPFFEPVAGAGFLGKTARGITPEFDLLGRPYANPPSRGCLERVDPPALEPGGNTYIFQTEG